MEIYILRHGTAEPQHAGRADSERKLTDEGREKLRLVLARARGAGVAPSLILTSPFIRAVQTAELAAQALGYTGEIEKTDALVPSSSSRQVWRLLRSRADQPAVLLSGHEPLLGETASYLVGSSRVCFDLKMGALLRIDVDDFPTEPRGVLQWLLTPKLAATRP